LKGQVPSVLVKIGNPEQAEEAEVFLVRTERIVRGEYKKGRVFSITSKTFSGRATIHDMKRSENLSPR